VQQGQRIKLIDLIICLSDAMDFIDAAVVNHHRQVAYIAYRIAAEMGLPLAQQKALVLAGALHDIGAFSLKERKDALRFEIDDPHGHAWTGFALLRLFEPLAEIAAIVKHHHVPWEGGRGSVFGRQPVHPLSHIIHISDRIAVLVDRKKEVLGQVKRICNTIRKKERQTFRPALVEVFLDLAAREYFWLDLTSPSLQMVLSQRLRSANIEVGSKDMIGFSQLFSRIIDFKSPFTATHSSGVAACAEALAGRLGFSGHDCTAMRIAGYMHDLGKLAVPAEILDKPARLNRGEYDVVRHHTFYTYRILEPIAPLRTINAWAAFHHERLDGSGYPFHLKGKDLPLGSQIMAVADVFTALAEDRPYRAGMKRSAALKILDGMTAAAALNGEVVAMLRKHYDELDAVRVQAQADARVKYRAVKTVRRSAHRMPGPDRRISPRYS
jgi:HD-GYP domain-containing protein (c-di-GMP phosphodiesterase class II)